VITVAPAMAAVAIAALEMMFYRAQGDARIRV
jgi:hypothetical protein